MAGPEEILTRPPRLARALVQACAENEVRESVLGDLHEEFAQLAHADWRAARRWYWREALATATPLLGRRVHRSRTASALLTLALAIVGIALLYAWQVAVARSAAVTFAETFPAAPLVTARLVYVGVQMLSVVAVTAGVALLTFRAEQSLLQNSFRRLGLLSALILLPPFVESFLSPNGYSLSFVLPWAAAMAIAIFLGGRAGERLVLSRQ